MHISRLRFEQSEIKRQKEVYFIFIIFCNVILLLNNPIPPLYEKINSIDSHNMFSLLWNNFRFRGRS